MQRENSPSGTTGTLTLYDVNGNGEDEVKVKFDCPYIGSNKCSFEGEIPGLTFERQSFSGSSGSIATCTILIKNA